MSKFQKFVGEMTEQMEIFYDKDLTTIDDLREFWLNQLRIARNLVTEIEEALIELRESEK